MLKLLQSLILQFLIGRFLIQCREQQCYKVKYLNFCTHDTADYKVSMKWHTKYQLMAVTTVLKTVQVPIWHIKIHQYPVKRNQPPKVLYNATYKICEFWKYVKEINIVNTVAQHLLSDAGSNMSFKCPLAIGTYVFNNIEIPQKLGLLRYLYSPNTKYTFVGAVYNQHPNMSLEKLGSYEINSTVIRRTC